MMDDLTTRERLLMDEFMSRHGTLENYVMPTMRAKVRVSQVWKDAGGNESLTFYPVAANQYPTDGADENNTYARYSPSGEFKLQVANPALHGKFAVGDTFYVDFTPAPK